MEYKLYLKYIISIVLGILIGSFLSNKCLHSINTVTI